MADLMNKYKELEFTLVTELTRVHDMSQDLDMVDIKDIITNEISRVKEKTFRVIVVGEFKRGKSTLINALLKRKVLPADIVPTTATVNRVAYDPNPYVRIYFKDGTRQDIDISKLSDYVTKLTSEGEAIASKIEEAVIFFPTPFCQNNIYIIDTPGLCDDDTMTAVTMNAIGSADAAIMVISALSPFSQTECSFVTKLILDSASLCRLVFAVNYIDKLDEDEVDKLLDYAKNRIYSTVLTEAKQRYGEDTDEYKRIVSIVDNAPVFGISSYLAINARINNDPKKLEQSRFPYFEQELENILAVEQGLSAIRTPFEKMIISCDRMIEKIDGRIKDNQDKLLYAENSDFLNIVTSYEQNMMNLTEGMKRPNNIVIQKIIDTCGTYQRELHKNGLGIFEKVGINESNFQASVIDSYFKYINSSINTFERAVFNTYSVKIQQEIMRYFNDCIKKLDADYGNILKAADEKQINVIDKAARHEFLYYLAKHPFPIYESSFMLPVDISSNPQMRQRFSAFLSAYSFRSNISMFWEKAVNYSMDRYRNLLINTYHQLTGDIVNEYTENYGDLLLQIKSGYKGHLNFLREKCLTVKVDYERKKQVISDIKSRSSALLDKIKQGTIDF